MDSISLFTLVLLFVTEILRIGSMNSTKSGSNGSQFVFDGSSTGYIITAGGWNGVDHFTNAYALNLNSGEWVDLQPLPQGLCGFNLVLRGSSVYAVGGQSAISMVKSTLILSTNENMWKIGSDLIYNYGWVLSAALNGSIYAVGGSQGGNTLQAMGCSGAWGKLAPSLYNHYEEGDAITVVNDKIYILGSEHTDEVYNPHTNTWKSIKMTNQDRFGAGIVALNGFIYVIGGANARNERYDPSTGELIYFKECLYNMEQEAAVVTDGNKIYVIGGKIAGAYSNKGQVYTPELDLWQTMDEYPITAGWMGAVYVKELPTD